MFTLKPIKNETKLKHGRVRVSENKRLFWKTSHSCGLIQHSVDVWELPKCIAVVGRKKSKLLPVCPCPFMVATTQKLKRNFLGIQISQTSSFQRWEATKSSLWFVCRNWNQTICWGDRSERCLSDIGSAAY